MRINYGIDRKRDTRKLYKTIYIFTESKGTEPIYFKSKKKEIEEYIRRKLIKVEILKMGKSTLSLVNKVVKYISANKIETDKSECWVVFDRDSFNKDFDIAINKANKKGIKVAYSNECFELWLLLHFDFVNSSISRRAYISKLTKKLQKQNKNNKKYTKTLNIYPLIKKNEITAIRNAKELLKIYKKEKSYLKKDPSTTVHLLVESLNKIKKYE